MQPKLRNALFAGCALVLVLLLGIAGYQIFSGKAADDLAQANAELMARAEGSATTGGLAQQSALNVTVYTEQGDSVTLASIANGRPLVLNFWATWCPYCLREMPTYQEIYDDYKDRVAFVFLDVADGSRETVEMAQTWLSDNGYTDLPVFYDMSLEASSLFGAYGLPYSAVVSAEGDVVMLRPGVVDASLLRGKLNTLV